MEENRMIRDEHVRKKQRINHKQRRTKEWTRGILWWWMDLSEYTPHTHVRGRTNKTKNKTNKQSKTKTKQNVTWRFVLLLRRYTRLRHFRIGDKAKPKWAFGLTRAAVGAAGGDVRDVGGGGGGDEGGHDTGETRSVSLSGTRGTSSEFLDLHTRNGSVSASGVEQLI